MFTKNLSSDHWEFYFANVGGDTVSFFYDEGISGRINSLPHKHAFSLFVTLKHPGENGMTTNAEFEALKSLEDEFIAVVNKSEGVFLGRRTGRGKRIFLGILKKDGAKIEQRLKAPWEKAGYSVSFETHADLRKRVYWDNLYPDDNSRRVLNDMKVLSNLLEHGDDNSIVRRVDHWSYFTAEDNARAFAEQMADAGYSILTVAGPDDASDKWMVQTFHDSSTLLNEISNHTLAHLRMAADAGGEYDGWETSVEKPADPTDLTEKSKD